MKPKRLGGVHRLNETIETRRPEAGGVNLHSYELSWSNLVAWVQNLNPAQIELLPSEEGGARGCHAALKSWNFRPL